MPTPKHTSLLELVGGLTDEMLAYYLDWRNDATAVADAYRVWQRALAAQATAHFAAYMAALDNEEAAATRYATVVKNLDRAL